MKYLKKIYQTIIVISILSANISCSNVTENSIDNSLMKVKQLIDIAPAWSGHPARFALVTAGDKQFVAFYAPNRQLTLAARDLNSTNWTFLKLDEFVALDAHNYIAMTIDRDGYLHLSANMHVNPLNYRRAEKPYDISSFKKLDFMTGDEETKCTYPIFFNDKAGNLLFKYRTGHSGSGNEIINIYDEKTKTWERKIKDDKPLTQNIIDQKFKPLPVGNSPEKSKPVKQKSDVPLLDGKGKMNAYQSGPRKGPDGFYHLGWVWRDQYGCQFNHDVQYARSKDLIHWEDSNGKLIKLPITIETGENVDPIHIFGGLLNSLKVCFDSKGRCVMTYFKFDQDANTQVYAARCEKGGWKIYQITDWTNRWDFNGGGSIPNMIVSSGISYKPGIGLFYEFRNKYIFGDLRRYVYFLDEKTLKPVSAPVPVYPDVISKIRSKVKGMQVNLSGHFPYYLHWETLGGQRDVVKDLDWVPKNQMLQLEEFEWNNSINMKAYVPIEERNASYKEFFSSGILIGNNALLIPIKRAVKEKNYVTAVKLYRKFLSLLPHVEIDSKVSKEKILKTADEFYQHKFDFNNIKRTLLFDINSWYPIKNDILKNWDVTRSLTLACRPVKFDELKKISPLADWYNQINVLPHLTAFGKAYAITKDSKYARMFIHDLQDWMYDNPAPSSPTVLPGPWYITIATKRLSNALTDYVRFFANSKDVSDLEFFYLINTVQKHKVYLKACLKSNKFDIMERTAANKALYKF